MLESVRANCRRAASRRMVGDDSTRTRHALRQLPVELRDVEPPRRLASRLGSFVDNDDFAASDPDGRREQLQTIADDFAIGRTRAGADFETNAIGLDG